MNWKNFKNWLEKEITEYDGLQVKIRVNKQNQYDKLSSITLTNFCDSLDATLDNNIDYHLFSEHKEDKSFKELFDFQNTHFGKKTNQEKTSETDYNLLEKLFDEWKTTQINNNNNANMTEIKNILLLGRTGNGKSTIGNVISGKNELKEGEFGVSETKDIQALEFEVYGDKYRLIDTIGIGDTELSLREVLYKFAKMSRYAKEGLNQVLFVTSGRFTEEERSTYNLLRKFIFDDEIVKYTTIVRTKFSNFRNDAKCKEDIQKMLANGGELADVIRSCQGRIIHVDNPPTNIEDEDEMAVNEKKRDRSQTILLTHLAKCDQVYKPTNLDTLNERISAYMTKEEELQKKLDEINETLRKTQEDNERKLKDFQDEQDKKYKKMEEERKKELRELKEESDRKIKEAQSQNKSAEQMMLLMEQIRQDRKDAEDRLSRERKESEERARQERKDYEARLKQDKEENDAKWQTLVSTINSQNSSQSKSRDDELKLFKGKIDELNKQISNLQNQSGQKVVEVIREKDKGFGERLLSTVGYGLDKTAETAKNVVCFWDWKIWK